ncbi:MAG: glycosyltransferase family 4 protein [Acidobacteriia bacterium]|nr:glycosyltransferase family 4 protein [Terriglobia bacterium]
MRILHLDAGKEMRGGQWQVLRLIEGLAAEGVASTLLARDATPLFEAARQRGCQVEILRPARVAALARSHDLVHAHDARSHTIAALLGSAPLVVARRVAFPVGSRWKYARARRYIAVSAFVKAVLRQGGVPEEKIAVVYDGVPLLEPAHGAAVLALANAADAQKGAPLAEEAARLAGVPLRWTTDLEGDLRDAALFVYITYSEGLGSASLLAMSAGVPVIASRVGGLPEIIRDGENGLLVDNTAPAIAEVIRKFTDSPDLAARLGLAARQSVQENFTIGRMVRRTMEVYRQVLT